MKLFKKVKKRYRIKPAENGDVMLQLDEGYASPENLFAAALDFLYEHPEYFLGSWTIVHPERKNVIYAAYATEATQSFTSTAKKTSRKIPPSKAMHILIMPSFSRSFRR
jgi:hypothetical protein